MKITEEQKKYAQNLAQKVYKDKKTNRDVGENAKNKPLQIDYTGFLGEVIYADHNNLPRPKLNKGKVDPGYDFKHEDGTTVDIKTSTKGKDLIIFPQNKYNLSDRLVRIYIDGDEAKVTMDVTREFFLENCEKTDLGYGDRLILTLKTVHKFFKLKNA